MPKILNGNELAGFIKQRQANEVRLLIARDKLVPKLVIVQLKDDPVINTYIRLKKKYGQDIGITVESHNITQTEAPALLKQLNEDKTVYGIIIQLPIEDPSKTDEIVNLIEPGKDVDALADITKFEPATPTAILWLLAGYNINLKDKQILIIGKGKLVGKPLEKILKNSGINVITADRKTTDLTGLAKKADIIISATGSPGIIHPDMIKLGAVVVDAGTASEKGKTVGDLDESVYERDDLTITPQKGGVGPLTVCSLFENVIKATKLTI